MNKMNLVIEKTGGHILYYLSKKLMLLWVVSILAFAGCASTEEMKLAKYDILQNKTRIERLNDRMKDLESSEEKEASSNRKAAIQKGQTAILSKVDNLSQEIQQLNNRLDEIEMTIGVSQIGNSRGKTLNQRIAALEDKSRASVSPPMPQEEEIHDTETVPVIPVKDASTVYKEANAAYERGDTKEARRQYELVLKEFPTSEYAQNAQYWIGESYYKEEDYDNAILAFEELIRKNPDSPKVPAALLKQGYAFYQIGERSIGKDVLEKLIKKYPASEEAKLAKKRIEGGGE